MNSTFLLHNNLDTKTSKTVGLDTLIAHVESHVLTSVYILTYAQYSGM